MERTPHTFTDLTGQTIGDVKIVSFDGFSKACQSYWIVEYADGSRARRRIDALHVRPSKPRRGAYPNGLSARTLEYGCWYSMIRRCYGAHCQDYKHYGARGITVCARWRESFPNFVADMGPRPGVTHSIDRIDVNGNYEPSNCRWATASEQQLNKRRKAKGA